MDPTAARVLDSEISGAGGFEPLVPGLGSGIGGAKDLYSGGVRKGEEVLKHYWDDGKALRQDTLLQEFCG